MNIRIRKMQNSDIGALYRLLSDPEVMRYLEPPYDRTQTETFLHHAGLATHPLVYAVEESKIFIGYVIYHKYDEESMEIGWVLFPEYWGHGYASVLTDWLICKARREQKNVVIECVPAQEATKRIAIKKGFHYCGNCDGVAVYRLVPEGHWSGRKKRPCGANIEIKKLSLGDGGEIYEMLQNIPANENGFINNVNGKSYEEFKVWLVKAMANSLQEGVIDGWKVPETTYWLYADGRPVGYGKIRHYLTDRLLADGGNVGYAIIPSERNKGFGKIFLKLLLQESVSLNVDKILFTIREENKASFAVAVANGGIVEKIQAGKYYVWINRK